MNTSLSRVQPIGVINFKLNSIKMNKFKLNHVFFMLVAILAFSACNNEAVDPAITVDERGIPIRPGGGDGPGGCIPDKVDPTIHILAPPALQQFQIICFSDIPRFCASTGPLGVTKQGFLKYEWQLSPNVYFTNGTNKNSGTIDIAFDPATTDCASATDGFTVTLVAYWCDGTTTNTSFGGNAYDCNDESCPDI